MVGIDLVDIERLETALARTPGLDQRFFTAAELQQAAQRGRPGRYLASRMAAKEAVLKALALERMIWHEIELLASDEGPPLLTLFGTAAERLESLGGQIHVSLAHEREMAIATAVVISSPTGRDHVS